jgi:hypothetical protein
MRCFLKQAVLALVGLIATYLVSWIAIYSVVMGGDYAFLAEYLTYGWSGGGELPTFIQAGALLLTLGTAAAFFFCRSRKQRSDNQDVKSE